METLKQAMQRADDIADLSDYVIAVKRAVRDVFSQLDPTVEMRDTDYFNHSAVPDFILRWPSREERPMYLRRSFDEIAGGNDVGRLAKSSPVVVSLKEDSIDNPSERSIRTQLASPDNRRNILVAGSVAVDSLVTAPTSDSPLTGIVGAELLPQGRGLLDQTAATSIIQPNGESREALAALLSERAMDVVRDSAELIDTALNEEAPIPQLRTQSFSLEEARQLLPWLLHSSRVRKDAEFWIAVGRRVSLKLLEQISPSLQEVDLSPLMFRMWDSWRAKRAYRGLAAPEFHQAELGAAHWYMRDRILALEVGNTAVRFATDGRSLMGKPSASSATWDKIKERIGEYRLLDVALRGISRTILLNANQSPDIRGDADTIHATLNDTYIVDTLTIQPGLRDEQRVVKLDLGSELAFNEGNASLQDLAAAILGVVQYNNPIDINDLEARPVGPQGP